MKRKRVLGCSAGTIPQLLMAMAQENHTARQSVAADALPLVAGQSN